MFRKFIIIVLILVSTSVLVSACANQSNSEKHSKNTDFVNSFNKANQLTKEKNYNDAISEYENALKYASTANEQSDAYLELGKVIVTTGDVKKSQEYLLKSVELNPEQYGAYIILGSFSQSLEQPGLALQYYQKAIAISSMPADTKAQIESLMKDISHKNRIPIIKFDLDLTKWQVSVRKTGAGTEITTYKNKDSLLMAQIVYTPIAKAGFKEAVEKHFAYVAQAYPAKKIAKKNIKETPDELIYEWTANSNEGMSIGRFIYVDNDGLYNFYFIRSGTFTPEEKKECLRILKEAEVDI